MGTKPTSVGIGKGRDPEALKHRLTDRPTMLRPSTMLAGACLALLSSCAPTLLPARPPIAEPPVKPTNEERVARPTIAERAASRDVMIGLQQQPTPRPSSTVPTGGDYQDGYPLLAPAPKARGQVFAEFSGAQYRPLPRQPQRPQADMDEQQRAAASSSNP